MTTPTPTPDDLADLSEADVAALQLALDLTLADDPPDPGRVDQVTDFLSERSWRGVSEFCAYHQQMARLDLPVPGMSPPCWIMTEAEADAIIAEGPSTSGSGEDISSCRPARLTKRMLRLGVSVYHPDPVRAVHEAQRAKRRKARR